MTRWEETDLAQGPPPPALFLLKYGFLPKKGKKNIVVCLVHVVYRHLVVRYTYSTS